MLDMRRRKFITLLGGAATWPLVARAQQRTMPVIGYLDTALASTTAHLVAAFRQGLSAVGNKKGRNRAIEYRWPDGDYDKLPSLADDLVRRNVGVIATINTPTILAAKRATKTIAIVFAGGYSVPRRQRNQLFALRDQERVAAHQQQSYSLLRKGNKSGLDATWGACISDQQAH